MWAKEVIGSNNDNINKKLNFNDKWKISDSKKKHELNWIMIGIYKWVESKSGDFLKGKFTSISTKINGKEIKIKYDSALWLWLWAKSYEIEYDGKKFIFKKDNDFSDNLFEINKEIRTEEDYNKYINELNKIYNLLYEFISKIDITRNVKMASNSLKNDIDNNIA